MSVGTAHKWGVPVEPRIIIRFFVPWREGIIYDVSCETDSSLLENGDTFLDCYKGFCNAKKCNFNCSGYTFIGNNTQNYLDMIFIFKNKMVHDLYECGSFKILQPGIEKKERIYIDKFEWIKPSWLCFMRWPAPENSFNSSFSPAQITT